MEGQHSSRNADIREKNKIADRGWVRRTFDRWKVPIAAGAVSLTVVCCAGTKPEVKKPTAELNQEQKGPAGQPKKVIEAEVQIVEEKPKPDPEEQKKLNEELLKLSSYCPGSKDEAVGELSNLIDKGADVNFNGPEGETPLMFVSRYCWWEAAIDLLLKNGADVNTKDKNGNSALMWACDWNSSNSYKKARTLLEGGADVNSANTEGSTALVSAAVNGHLDTVALLVDYGADVNKKNNKGETVLAVVKKVKTDLIKTSKKHYKDDIKNLDDVMEYLKEQGAKE